MIHGGMLLRNRGRAMRKKKVIEDRILEAQGDRRLMPNVPDPSNRRSNHDRRDNKSDDDSRPQYATYAGQRFNVHVKTQVLLDNGKSFDGTSVDISQTGMMLQVPEEMRTLPFEKEQHLRLTFRLQEGDLQEGTEKKYKKIQQQVNTYLNQHIMEHTQ